MRLERITCPVCGREVPVTTTGRIREHKPDPTSARVCRASAFRPTAPRLTEIAAETKALAALRGGAALELTVRVPSISPETRVAEIEDELGRALGVTR